MTRISWNTMRSSLVHFSLQSEDQWRLAKTSKVLRGIAMQECSLSVSWGSTYILSKHHEPSQVSVFSKTSYTLSQDSFQKNITWHNWIVERNQKFPPQSPASRGTADITTCALWAPCGLLSMGLCFLLLWLGTANGEPGVSEEQRWERTGQSMSWCLLLGHPGFVAP